jgi:hypothetical protein
MLKLIIVINIFDSRIRDAAVVLEKRWQAAASNVATLVDRRGENRTAVFTKPNRVVGSTTKK